ncbi:MAG TPA: DNRLRE domain-containing protein [bacterium]|nr:DNRLRE domain-containing protein [bacterium]
MKISRAIKRIAAVYCFALAVAFSAGCSTKEDHTLGVGLIEDLGDTKAVQTVTLSPPDTTEDFQLTSSEGSSGQSASLLLGIDSGILSRPLVRFDVTALPDSGQSALVDTSFVRFFFDESSGDPQSLVATIHRVGSVWNESIAAADSLPIILAPLDTIPFSFLVTGDSLDVPITELTRFWIDHPESTFGLALIPDSLSTTMHELFSSESAKPPQLITTWNTGTSDTTVTLPPVEDLDFLRTTSAFVPVTELPGRMAVARAIPARSLIKFELPDFGPRATVNRAELTLYVDPANSRLHEFTIAVQRVTGEWTGATTPVDALLDGAVSGEFPLVSATSDSVVLNVTTTASNWVAQGNFGLRVRANNEIVDAEFVRFHAHDSEDIARRPKIKIWYTPGDPEGTR